MYYEVCPAKVFRKSSDPLDGILTYESDQEFQPGQIVQIPLGKSEVAGIIYKKVSKPTGKFKLKKIIGLVYDTPLPPHILKSILWLSEYYLTPLPEIINMFLPKDPLAPLKKLIPETNDKIDLTTEIPLNTAQKNAISELKDTKPNTKLLHGITGSGKTNIYLSLSKETIKSGKSVILLVPEISLTSQLVQIFNANFKKNIVLIHSKQTDKTRKKIWENELVSNRPKIFIGPRSALLLPVKNLGLIIIDEAHESAYYQESQPKYHALRLASYMANVNNIPCIFGTATPLISDYYLAKKNKSLIELNQKAKDTAIKPNIKIVDLKDHSSFNRNQYFSDILINEIKENLKNHQQTLIFHNRRGSAPLTICESCGWQALCPNCFLPLTLHSDEYKLICHTCGYQENVPKKCPNCGHLDIIHKGFGTKLLEIELKKLFKEANIVRFDADNKKSETLAEKYDDVKSGNVDIIIGTQTIAKGLDLPHLATVGVVQADANLSLPDFAAEERTFHLLTQVIGRIGRGHLEKATAIIQTYQPDSKIIEAAINSDYETFYKYLIDKRRTQHMPPFSFIAKLYVVYKTETMTVKKIQNIKAALDDMNKNDTFENLEISTTVPAFHEHISTGYVWQIILKSSSRKTIISAIKALNDFKDLRIVIDPPSLL